MDFVSLANQLLKGNIIMTTQGVLFQKHGTVKNPFYNFIQYLVDKRDEAKNEMKKHPKGSELYNKYNLQQLNYKVSCNALYGCAGNWSSIFYNLYLCTAVTGQGRGCISASITMFEGLLADNMKFETLTEVFTFMNNICNDQKKENMHKFNDYEILDHNVSLEQAYLKIVRNCNWAFNDNARDAIWQYMSNLDQRELNVIYYKNNLYEFCSNSRIIKLILDILCKLEEPFLDPNKPNPEIKDDIHLLQDILFEYVYYRHIWIDKLERVYSMIRDVVLITDTDSCIVSLDEWYRFVRKYTFNVPMKIKYTREQIKKKAGEIILQKEQTECHNEYDFYNDEIIELKHNLNPLEILPQDNVRYAILNMITYVLDKLVNDYMERVSINNHSYRGSQQCKIRMK